MTSRKPAPERPDTPLLERDGLIGSDELATFLGESLSTLDIWASRGGGPPFHKVGKYRKYLPADVSEWLRTRRRDPGQEPAA